MEEQPKVTEVDGWDMALNEASKRRGETAVMRVIPGTGRVGIHFPRSGDYVDPNVPFYGGWDDWKSYLQETKRKLRRSRASWDEERI